MLEKLEKVGMKTPLFSGCAETAEKGNARSVKSPASIEIAPSVGEFRVPPHTTSGHVRARSFSNIRDVIVILLEFSKKTIYFFQERTYPP